MSAPIAPFRPVPGRVFPNRPLAAVVLPTPRRGPAFAALGDTP